MIYRERYYSPYRSYSRTKLPLQEYFGPVMGKLKNAFLSLDNDTLEKYLEKYEYIYGTAAANYARRTYPDWKSHYRNISNQTLSRILMVLPPFLNDSQRINILKDIVMHNSAPLPMHVTSVVANWENYHEVLADIRERYIPGQLSDNCDSVLKSISIPNKVFEMASWLYSEDMQAAYRVLQDMYINESIRLFKSAQNDITTFENVCAKMQANGLIYEDVQATVNLPNREIYIVLHKSKKIHYIISTAYFWRDSSQTEEFRKWRDSVFKRSKFGAKFINWYYANGYKMAPFFGRHSFLRRIVCFLLDVFYSLLLRWKSSDIKD